VTTTTETPTTETPTRIAVDAGPLGEAVLPGLRDALGDAATVDVVPEAGAHPTDEVLLTMPTDRAALERALGQGVRWVHVLATGVDGFAFDLLDGRTLTCSRGASATAIAEWVLAVMLAFEKDLPRQWLHEPPAHWNLARLGTLSHKTLGLVGMGAIGSEVARRADAFDMQVTAVRRRPQAAPEGVTLLDDLDELLATADHVVVAAPSTPDTRHLIGERAFAAMKPGAHLVNIARGALVDQDALRRALDEGSLAGASLDVVDPEPLPEGHWLFAHPKVRVSAHVSWSAPTTIAKTVGVFVDNVHRFRRGAPLEGVVDPVAGY
jgi:phosphoglycerate dehydrogenase-like enzyme